MKKLFMTTILLALGAAQAAALDMPELMKDAQNDLRQPKMSAPAAKTFVYKGQAYNSLYDANQQMENVADTLKKLGYNVMEKSTKLVGGINFNFTIIYTGEQPLKTRTYNSSLIWTESQDADQLMSYRIKQMSEDKNFKLLESNVYLSHGTSWKYAVTYIGAPQPKNKIYSGKLKYAHYSEATDGMKAAIESFRDVTITEAAVDFTGFLFDFNYTFKIAYVE